MTEPKFKTGDRVDWCGVIGTVREAKQTHPWEYPICVEFSASKQCCFTEDGRQFIWHREPSLKLVERPKQKVTKTVERWMNAYHTTAGIKYSHAYSTPEEAGQDPLVRDQIFNRIACIRLTGEYSVEE